MTATAEPVVAPAVPQAQPLPPFGVVLHNDDVNDIGRVVETLVEIVRIRLPDAFELTMEAHNEGQAVVCRTHRERAEFLRDQLISKGLRASMQRI